MIRKKIREFANRWKKLNFWIKLLIVYLTPLVIFGLILVIPSILEVITTRAGVFDCGDFGGECSGFEYIKMHFTIILYVLAMSLYGLFMEPIEIFRRFDPAMIIFIFTTLYYYISPPIVLIYYFSKKKKKRWHTKLLISVLIVISASTFIPTINAHIKYWDHIDFCGCFTDKLKKKDAICYDGMRFSKDKTNVLWQCQIIPFADPETFIPYEEGYSKDKNSVYHYTKKIETADPETFEYIKNTLNDRHVDNGYAKDKNNVYRFGDIIEGADPKTFQMLGDGYSKDDKHVFRYEKIVTE